MKINDITTLYLISNHLGSILLEDKISFIAQQQGDKLVSRVKDDTGETMKATDILVKLNSADPTKNQSYLRWLTNVYLSGQFKLEDVSRIKDELITFERVKSKLQQKDINQYKKLTDLYAALTPYENKEIETKGQEDKKYKVEMYKQATILHKGEDGMLLSPKTKEASCYFGKGTKWCTAATSSQNMFDYYNKRGPLFIWIEPNGDKFQFHFYSRQCMDSSDISLKPSKLHMLLTKKPIRKIFDEYEKEIAHDPDIAVEYTEDMIGYGITWSNDLVKVIADSPTASYTYALDVLELNNVPEIILNSIASSVSVATSYANKLVDKHIEPHSYPQIMAAIASSEKATLEFSHTLISHNIYPPDVIMNAIVSKDAHMSIAYWFAEQSVQFGAEVPAEVEKKLAQSPEYSYKYMECAAEHQYKVSPEVTKAASEYEEWLNNEHYTYD